MHTIEQAVKDIKEGKFVIIVDDNKRENEGDLVIAAQFITPEKISFILQHTSGIICVPLTKERLDHLQLPVMVQQNTDFFNTPFTVSVDARANTTTGVSAQDRYNTIKTLIDPNAQPHDLRRPGHSFPLRYTEGGVLKRPGHTEATVDLMKIAGLTPAGVICEMMNPDGTMARLPDLEHFSKKHNISLISVADIIEYRKRHEKLIIQLSKARLPTDLGEFTVYAYESTIDHVQHLCLFREPQDPSKPLLVRIHSECLTGDVFKSRRCDCGDQLTLAMKQIAREGGAIIYLRGHEGRGIGLGHKIRAYHLQDKGEDTVEANLSLGFPPDMRQYDVAAQILRDLNINQIHLLTNNPEKHAGLSTYGIEVIERVPLESHIHDDNRGYLMTKKQKLGHLFNHVE